MTKKYRLQSMQSAQCHVIIETDEYECINTVTLVSYNTTVCRIYLSAGACRLECYGTYSVTTARHINRFTTEFCGVNMYHECKRIVNNGSIRLTFGQGFNCRQQCNRYLNDSFPKNVRKYFGKY